MGFLHKSGDSVHANHQLSHLPSCEGKFILAKLGDYSQGGKMFAFSSGGEVREPSELLNEMDGTL